MQQTLTINDTLLKNAAQCVGLDDVNAIVNLALQELVEKHKNQGQRRFPPNSIAGKTRIMGDLITPCFTAEDFECLK